MNKCVLNIFYNSMHFRMKKKKKSWNIIVKLTVSDDKHDFKQYVFKIPIPHKQYHDNYLNIKLIAPYAI